MPTVKKIEENNTFSPSEHLENIKGKPYLPVQWRIVWFRQENPGWAVVTEIIEHDQEKKYAIMKCTILNEKGQVMATSHKREDISGFGDYLEKAETGSIGRSLALCGFGTQFSPDLEEGNTRIVDAPASPKGTFSTSASKNASEGVLEPLRAAYIEAAGKAGIDEAKAKQTAIKWSGKAWDLITAIQFKALTQAMDKRSKKEDLDLDNVLDQDLESVAGL